MDIKGKKFLVIGGAGFIGSHIVDQLLEAGAQKVVIYDNFFRGRMDNITEALKNPNCEIFPHGGDVLYPDILQKAMEGIDGVFHLAALWLLQCHEYPRTAFEVNVQGTFNVVECAIKTGIKKVIFSSSASVYGDALSLPMTEDHPYNNFTFYGATKIAGEHFFKSLGNRYNMQWSALRYMNVYGPRQDYSGAYTAVMHKILDKIELNQSPEIFGDGSQEYDFIDVDDVARCNLLAMQSESNGKFYNVGRGIGTTLRELTNLLLKLKKCNLPIKFTAQGKTFVTQRVGCTKLASEDLRFNWKIDLEEGMKRLIDWRDNDKQAVLERSQNRKGVSL